MQLDSVFTSILKYYIIFSLYYEIKDKKYCIKPYSIIT